MRFNRPEDLLRLLPARPPRFRPGDRLPGVDYVLEELVGMGGFGEVWKARHAHLRSQPPVALKFCLDETAAPALGNEAGMLDRVLRHGKHPGIVALLQTYLSADPPCLAYEYVAGGDLTGLIRELHEQKQMTPLLASQLLLCLAEIVGHVHAAEEPIVHSDLKPANILVNKVDGDYQLRVTDFGIGGLAASLAAREARQPTRSRQELVTEAVRGAYTPLYAPPQQMARRRGEKADTRDDVHALGVIWYQMVTGDLAMTSFPPDWREHMEECGMEEDQVKLLGSCIAARSEKRPETAGELARRLKSLLPEAKARREDPKPEVTRKGHPFRHGMPGPLDCTGAEGVSAADVRKAQEGWASYLKREVEETVDIGNGVKMTFVLVPPGKFRMGSPTDEAGRSDDETLHEVTLTEPFYLGKYPVTQKHYEALTGKNPSNFKGATFPVEQVTWEEAQGYAARLTEKLNDRHLYRLPTEAEWEYSCRGGRASSKPFGIGDGRSLSSLAANFDGNHPYGGADKRRYLTSTCDVGSYLANALGLFDMHGNVWEWCADWYGPYPARELTNPTGSSGGSGRVFRGGSWYFDAGCCRAAYRSGSTPSFRSSILGFRLARSLPTVGR
jgi:formylglycine-generating enzyme required for sulfatase activity